MMRAMAWDAAWFIEDDSFTVGSICPECGARPTERVYGIAIAYQEGPPQSFAVGTLLAQVSVAEDLASRFSGLALEPVYIYKSEWAGPFADKRPKYAKRYVGPQYVELRFTKDIKLDAERSTLDLTNRCSTCNRGTYRILGMERESEEELIDGRWMKQSAVPRDPSRGLFVSREELGDNDFFTYGGVFKYCTEEVRDFILSRNYTNMRFLECGTVVD